MPDELALAWFRALRITPYEEWIRLADDAQRQSFTLPEVSDPEVLRFAFDQVESAIREGTPLEIVERTIRRRVGATPVGETEEIATALHTYVMRAYAARERELFSAPAAKRRRPYWLFSAVDDARCCEVCRNLKGQILDADDPSWKTGYPPIHPGCRCRVIALTEQQASLRRGGRSS